MFLISLRVLQLQGLLYFVETQTTQIARLFGVGFCWAFKQSRSNWWQIQLLWPDGVVGLGTSNWSMLTAAFLLNFGQRERLLLKNIWSSTLLVKCLSSGSSWRLSSNRFPTYAAPGDSSSIQRHHTWPKPSITWSWHPTPNYKPGSSKSVSCARRNYEVSLYPEWQLAQTPTSTDSH